MRSTWVLHKSIQPSGSGTIVLTQQPNLPPTTIQMASTPGASSSGPVKHNAVPPTLAASAAKTSRIAPHSHIKGLGLHPDGLAMVDGAGFVGQTVAREVTISPLSAMFTIYLRAIIGLRCNRRINQISQVFRTRVITGRRTGHRKDSFGSSRIARTWIESAILSHGGIGGIQRGSEKNRSVSRSISEGYWCVTPTREALYVFLIR